MEGKTRLLILDGSNLFYRAYFGLHQKLSHNGIPTWGIYGTINTVSDTIRRHQPTHVVIVFDWGKSEYRLRVYPEYKASRAAKDEIESTTQLERVQTVLEHLGLSVWKERGIEADDIIATICARFRHEMDEIIIISGDKDLKQLVNEKIVLSHPSLGSKPEKIWTEQAIIETYGLFPEQLTWVFALSGDKIDNIPGAAGIGETTAIKLIKKHGDISVLLLSDERIIEGKRHDIIKSLDLVRLHPELSLFNLDNNAIMFLPTMPDGLTADQVVKALAELGFESILTQWQARSLWRDRGKRLNSK